MPRRLGQADVDHANEPILLERKVNTATLRKGAETRKAIIQALDDTMGNVTEACKLVGIHRQTYYKHLAEHPDFKELTETMLETQIDFAEKELFRQIANGNSSSTQFFLKTRGKQRGYSEKIETTETKNLNVNFSYETVKSEKLEQVKEIMEAQVIEQQKKAEDGLF